MEKMTDLKDLLRHEIKDLYSVEEQIIEAMPQMIEKANDPQLKQGLERHLRITEGQLKRLDQVKAILDQDHHEIQERKNNGLFARLMRRSSQESGSDNGEEKCLGMEGIIKESKKMLAEEMEPSVLDAAIIACAQKIEHYEICGYGTARAYARELNIREVADLLEQTLDEEYEADDRLTEMAVGRLNEEAEMRDNTRRASRSSASSAAGRSGSRKASPSTSRSRTGAAVAASSSRNGKSSASRGTSGSTRTNASSGRSSSAASGRSTGRTKASAKTSSRNGGSAAPAGKASTSRSTSKSSGRSAGTSRTRTASASRSSKAPSKTTAAKGSRSASNGRTTAKRTGRSAGNGRSSSRG